MSKVNIANYVVYDLANRFNVMSSSLSDSDIVGVVADEWNKKHFLSAPNDMRFNYSPKINKKIII